MRAPDGEWLSEAEYLERERASETKHEYRDGHVVAMAGASPEHNLICANVVHALCERMREKPCVVLTSDFVHPMPNKLQEVNPRS